MMLVLAGGCATGDWQADNVPVPNTTPYDGNQLVRQAYLDGFRQGYRAQKSTGLQTVETVGGPNAEARRRGFYAGAAQARSEMVDR